jgi:hypothetical protein
LFLGREILELERQRGENNWIIAQQKQEAETIMRLEHIIHTLRTEITELRQEVALLRGGCKQEEEETVHDA